VKILQMILMQMLLVQTFQMQTLQIKIPLRKVMKKLKVGFRCRELEYE